MSVEHLDVLVVGAGLSGIGAGYHLQKNCPGRSFAILEARQELGGTWSLFRFPGMRSDSDMYTLGYSFCPWQGKNSIADGPSILQYLRDTAREHGIDQKIRYGHRIRGASWSSSEARWTVEVERGEAATALTLSCNFLFMCNGYYDYAQGYRPDFPGADRFAGPLLHPQHWPEGLDYAGKRIVVIGSGATAMTMVPELARKAAHVTMLQRSPTYVVARPSVDPVGVWLKRNLPQRMAHGLTRWKNILLGLYFFSLCRRKPERAKALLRMELKKELGPGFDLKTHFTPSYGPWQQRLCLVPDGDLFRAIREQRVSVVTDHIETFTEAGIRLKSGVELPADVIVTATGLNLQTRGGIELSVDGKVVDLPRSFIYRGLMHSDLPNLAFSFGYINASWTLKSDLTATYVCRLLNHMQKTGSRICTPRLQDPDMEGRPWVDFSSGYIQRALADLPKQGTRKPWKLNQNYIVDLLSLRYGRLEDGVMQFSR